MLGEPLFTQADSGRTFQSKGGNIQIRYKKGILPC